MNDKKYFYGLTHKTYYPDISYVLGVIAGDACVYKQIIKNNKYIEGGIQKTYTIELAVKDFDFAKEFANKARKITRRPDMQNNKKNMYKKNNGIYRVCVRSKLFGQWYFNKKDEQEKIILDNPKEFLKGFYDSEGNLNYYKSWAVRLFNTDYKLLMFVKKLLKQLNFNSRLHIFRKSDVPTNYKKVHKTLYMLYVHNGKKFVMDVGSSIPRKSINRICFRCGFCCKKATCSIGIAHGAQPTNCMFLTGKRPGEYSCLLAEKEVYPDIKMHLGIGIGCCSPLNTDRRIAIENIEKLGV